MLNKLNESTIVKKTVITKTNNALYSAVVRKIKGVKFETAVGIKEIDIIVASVEIYCSEGRIEYVAGGSIRDCVKLVEKIKTSHVNFCELENFFKEECNYDSIRKNVEYSKIQPKDIQVS